MPDLAGSGRESQGRQQLIKKKKKGRQGIHVGPEKAQSRT